MSGYKLTATGGADGVLGTGDYAVYCVRPSRFDNLPDGEANHA
jgi:hypothetical protein